MNILRDCEDALGVAVPLARAGNAAMSAVFDDILGRVDKLRSPAAREVAAVAHFGAAALEASQGRHLQAHRRRMKAIGLINKVKAPGDRLYLLDEIADGLMDLGENRKALPYCNRAVAVSRGPAAILGARLFRAARCHRRVGFNEAAMAQLHEAIPLLRGDTKIPYLAYALLELGAVAYKTEPKEGVDAFREAADLFEAKGDIGNAGTSWLNLGVALSDAGKLDDALEAYGKARVFRERNPATTSMQRGNLHNNVAGLYRRKRDFARARTESEAAIKILRLAGGEYLAHAIGTLGEICRDEGKREEALEHLTEARALFERLPDPNLDKLATKLENEADALTALGRTDEAAGLRGRATGLREQNAPPTPAIPLDKVTRENGAFEATVVIELDGQNLPNEVYAKCDLASLERLLEDRLGETGAGDLDGHYAGPEMTAIHLVGADARALFEVIKPVLRSYPLCDGAQIELRQGEETTRVSLGRRSAN